jgi:hypothetical protein
LEVHDNGVYLVSAVPKHGRLDELADRLARAEFMSLRPFGPTLSASLGASEKTAWPCGRSPLAQERAAVLDNYFHDLRVEPVAEGEGWSKIDALPLLLPDFGPARAMRFLGTLSRCSSRPRYRSPRPISSSSPNPLQWHG